LTQGNHQSRIYFIGVNIYLIIVQLEFRSPFMAISLWNHSWSELGSIRFMCWRMFFRRLLGKT